MMNLTVKQRAFVRALLDYAAELEEPMEGLRLRLDEKRAELYGQGQDAPGGYVRGIGARIGDLRYKLQWDSNRADAAVQEQGQKQIAELEQTQATLRQQVDSLQQRQAQLLAQYEPAKRFAERLVRHCGVDENLAPRAYGPQAWSTSQKGGSQ